VLERNVEIFADVVVLGDGVEEFIGDAVGVGVEEAEPTQVGDACELVEEGGEAVFEAEIFAIASCVLADEGEFLNAALDELAGFGDDGFEPAERNLPRRLGMTQKVQGWSQPSAILM